MHRLRVTLFRDLPSEGWRSMEVYADQLVAALRSLGCEVSTYAPAAPRPSGRANVPTTYFWRTLVYPLAARRRQGEVNHIIDHSYGHLVNRLDWRRTVVTCHDIAPLVRPDRPSGFGLSLRLWRYAYRGMLRAGHIIAASEHTRRDLLRCCPYPPSRVTVVHHGVDHQSFYPRSEVEQAIARSTYGLPDGRVILHVGHCGQRKNLETLLQAFAALDRRRLAATLVQCGGQFTPAQRGLIARLQIGPWVRQIPFVAAQHLPALYSLAHALILPSWYEGFGLPALEAMACGTPVVAANTSALPEVVADAGLLVDPADTAGLANAIQRLLVDSSLRADLRARGIARAKHFSWERCARETLAVYAEVQSAPGDLSGPIPLRTDGDGTKDSVR
ncbi:MAG TPA: glycosyltransferase family 1 protein [Alphaproteobacteria bacterium]|nr:glycosyltransferase family 1 protein [Alphaproteobacteria bacterium]